jgi:hypothetical protein|tara:strand:- start:168 stop:3140 length:2973 start_codon:yes stop_codon:yes gene_type:complete
MAAVTLKDLMDPLKKIEAAANETNEKLDSLIAVSTGASNNGGMAIVSELQKQTGLLLAIAENTRQIDEKSSQSLTNFLFTRKHRLKLLDAVKEGREKKKEGGGGAAGGGGGKLADLKALGIGSIKTAMGMILWAIVPKKGVDKFVDFIERTFTKLADQDTKKVQEGISALDMMGGAIFKFAKGLALATPLLLIGAIGIPILYLTTILVTPLFLLLGMAEKQIKGGAEALEGIGGALIKFATGLAVFALVTALVMMGGPMLMLAMGATLLLIGGTVAILGIFDKQIKKGSVALAMMGIGLAVFGLGYALFAFTIAKTAPTLESIAIQAGVLIGIGLVTAILGSLFSLIIQGAASLAAMGIGLLIFGLGYIPFAHATKDTTMEDVGVQSALLTAVGLLFAAAGAGAMFIIPGALAFAAIGGALLLLAPGLSAIQKVKFTEQDAKDLTTTLAGVKLAFVGPPKGGGVGGFFKSIAGAISGGADAVAMVSAAAGFAAAGMALTKLSAGLKAYQKLDWTSEQSVQLAEVLSGITTAFAQAGGEAATPTGLFGAVFGNAFSPNATKKGISSVMGAGKALTSIAQGLTEFQKLVESQVDFDVLGEAISTTVGFIQRAFAAVAEEGNVDAGGFFGSLFGIKKNKVAEGLESVQGAGKALTDIAVGLTEFQKLVKSKVNFDEVGAAISKSVGFVQEAFAAVADQGNVKAGGFWGSLLGIKKNKVQEGIQSVQGAGAELKNIADALSTFSGIEDPAATAEKIKVTLGLVGQAFASIGGMEETDTGLFGISWDENKVQKGIEAVDGAGSALTDIAKGLKAFSGDFEPVAVSTSVGKLLTSIGTAFSDLYAANPEMSEELDDFKSFIVTLGDVAEKGQLDKAAEGISKIADSINKIDIDKAISFGNLFDSASSLSSDRGAYRALAKAVEDIRDMMEAGDDGPNLLEKAANFVDGGSRGKSAKGGSNSDLKKTLNSLNRSISSLPQNISTAIQTVEISVSGPA